MEHTFKPQERRIIYKKALENYKFPNADQEGSSGNGVCAVLHNLGMLKGKLGNWFEFERNCLDIFPELKLFKDSAENYWLDGTDRYLVLCFCMELTK